MFHIPWKTLAHTFDWELSNIFLQISLRISFDKLAYSHLSPLSRIILFFTRKWWDFTHLIALSSWIDARKCYKRYYKYLWFVVESNHLRSIFRVRVKLVWSDDQRNFTTKPWPASLGVLARLIIMGHVCHWHLSLGVGERKTAKTCWMLEKSDWASKSMLAAIRPV